MQEARAGDINNQRIFPKSEKLTIQKYHFEHSQ